MNKLNIVYIYTDGACKGNPGVGGWGAILKYENTEKEINGFSKNTTNNVDIPLKFRRRQSTAIMEKTTYKAKDSFTLKNNNNFSSLSASLRF